MVVTAISFAIGLACYWFYGGVFQIGVLLVAGLLLASALIFEAFIFPRFRQQPYFQWFKQTSLGLALGILYAFVYIHVFPPWQPAIAHLKEVHQLECTVSSLPAQYPHYTAFLAEVNRFDGSKNHGLVKVYWSSGGRQVRVGQQWLLPVKLKPVIGVHNSVGLDRERSLFRNGVVMTATVQSKLPKKILQEHHGYNLQRLRASLSHSINTLLGNDPRKGLIKALALADKRDLSPNDYSLFVRTGTSHLLAISGFHIGLAAGFGWLIAGLIWGVALRSGQCHKQHLQMLASLSFALAYAALAGFAIPTLRAIVMLFCGGIYTLSQRRIQAWPAWSAALFIVCLADPLALLSPSFMLSFFAVAALILLTSLSRHTDHAVKTHLTHSACLMFLMMPLTLLLFQQISLLSYFANLLAIPWMMFAVVPLALLGVAAIHINHGLAYGLLHAASWLLDVLFEVLEMFSSLPHAVWFHALPSWWLGLVFIIAVVLALYPRSFPGKAFVPLLLLPLFAPWHLQPAEKSLRMTVIDVGQGLSLLFQTPHHSLLFDAGPTRVAGGMGGTRVLAPLLMDRGVKSLDRVIISHGDDDHQGGLPALMGLVPAEQIFAGEPKKLKAKGLSAQPCRAGQHWRWDGVDFALLHPTKRAHKGNNQSCVLQVTYNNTRLLVPGDLEKSGEKRLVNKYKNQLHSTILVAGHHGSKTSSSASFIAKVQPKWVIFSSGYLNRYGFPHAVVVDRFHTIGAKLSNTAYDGEMTWVLNANGDLKIDSQHDHDYAFWSKNRFKYH